mgnify:CR=1 FL=1
MSIMRSIRPARAGTAILVGLAVCLGAFLVAGSVLAGQYQGKLEAENNKLRAQLEARQVEVEDARSELASSKAEAADLASDLASAKEELAIAKEELAIAQEGWRAARGLWEKSEANLKTSEGIRANLAARLVQMDGQLRALTQEAQKQQQSGSSTLLRILAAILTGL